MPDVAELSLGVLVVDGLELEHKESRGEFGGDDAKGINSECQS